MKARLIIIPAIILLAACQRMEFEVEPEMRGKTSEPGTLTVRASKGEPQTKALDLVNDGTRLNAYWKNTEKVKVYKGAALLGTLSVLPDDGEKPATATLEGKIDVEGLSVTDVLTLLVPRSKWDYTGQTGALTGSGSLEEKYAFYTAEIAVSAISGDSVSTTHANFSNEQSVYRFGFKLGGNYIDPKDFTVSAAGGKLVTGRTFNGSAWASSFGSICLTPVSAPADHFYYVSLRNENTAADSYGFIVTGSDNALYLASKAIPATALDAPGKFISAKNISVTQPSFASASGELPVTVNVF